MNAPRVPTWLPFAIALMAALSLYSISLRYRVEQRNKAVSIAAEYETVETLAAASGKSVPQALEDLKQQGLGAVVISEDTVGDLADRKAAENPAPDDSSLANRIQQALTLRFGDQKEISSGTAKTTPASLDPDHAQIVRAAQLTIVARMSNPPGVTGRYVTETLKSAHDLGATVFLPLGDQVLGRRDALKDMVDELKSLGMLYASPEFAKLGGDSNVLKMAPEIVVRLHSAQSAELDKMPLDDAVDRYSRAARERGMRLLLVRPISFAAQNPLTSFGDFIRLINRDIEDQGGGMGVARPYEDSGVPKWLFIVIGLSIIPTAYWVGSIFVTSTRWRIAGLILTVAICALSATNHQKAFTALFAALVFPIAAFLILDARKRPNLILDFLLTCAISLVGGLAVAGLLNGLPYFVRAEQFEGVKLAVFLPVFIILGYFLMRGADLKATMRNPMTWGAALLALVIMGALTFLSSRTGNDNPAGVSDTELKLRFLLDQILFVRPRTKEFMIGHPLLIIGIGLMAIQKARAGLQGSSLPIWTALALAGGAVGQTDIVNTMCHIHTPVALSLARIGVGMVAGCIIGLALWAIVRRWATAGDT